MKLEERIKTYGVKKYDRFYWWRRFKIRDTQHPYQSLQSRIEHGDFEVSDYHWMVLWEDELEKEALAKEKSADKKHEIRSLFGERKRRLLIDFEKDEERIKSEMYKAFDNELRMTKSEVEEEMLQFDSTLSEFYCYIYNKKKQNGN
jgi:hypothetical protein